jgi:2-succinyl-6-hydroxy-2,4-cyclohexadiene-1-carboxylate synthase
VTAPRYRLIALHGFLGSAADWDVLKVELPEAAWEAIDLWEIFSSGHVGDWEAIGDALGRRIQSALAHDSLPSFVLGYSFGGRLALAVPALPYAGSGIAGTCLISCHPGLPDGDEGGRAARREADGAWAQLFIDAPVARIWKEWDAQPVFATTGVPERENRLPAPRAALARAMRVASLGSQPDRRPLLLGWQRPLLWMVGDRDAKFCALSEALRQGGAPATFSRCEHAGHRVPWDNPVLFARTLTRWIDGVIAGE